jgi:dipeptidyl aminopeptidase/acylaminoacyl peptidase
MSRDETKVLIRTYSDRSLGAYYYLNRTSNEFQKLADVSPWLNEEDLAEMKPITYTSRDGLTIHGYLTLPRGLKPKKLPVVVNPHGGPWGRDVWGFDPEVQFLANRGYAVLQMNFRTSTGYGRKFWEAGFKQWGLAIQDDISDGVKWLIDQGIADSKKVGVYGGSFGGYATLAGVTFTPDLYACGVDYVGISNLFTLINSIPPYWEPMREMFYEMIGHPEKDKELYKKISPIFHADMIKVPLLVAQGANDPRVNKQESDQIVEALKKRGIEVSYMVKDNEGHGFMNEENRFDFYRAMEEFLGKHLGGRVESKTR